MQRSRAKWHSAIYILANFLRLVPQNVGNGILFDRFVEIHSRAKNTGQGLALVDFDFFDVLIGLVLLATLRVTHR